MRRNVLLGIGAAALATAGCVSILSIPDRTADWCNRPENAHDFCDDFDHEDAGGEWQQGVLPGSSVGFAATGETPPNAAQLSTTPQPLGAQTVVGIFKQFDNEKFDHITVGVDVQFVKADLQTEAGVEAQLGFLLVEDQDFCIGVVLAPGVMGMVFRAHQTDCTGVTNLPAGAGVITDDAGLTEFAPIGAIPTLGTWVHIKLDIKRNTNGSGTVGFTMNYPGVVAPPQIPAGYLTESAPPLVAVATSIVGPSGNVEVLFDNVTIDFPKD
jgi:hypothetical protein